MERTEAAPPPWPPAAEREAQEYYECKTKPKLLKRDSEDRREKGRTICTSFEPEVEHSILLDAPAPRFPEVGPVALRMYTKNKTTTSEPRIHKTKKCPR